MLNSIKNKRIKLVSGILILSIILIETSCGRKSSIGGTKSRSGVLISEDSPWFNSSVISVESGVDTDKEIEYSYQVFAGADDKYIVVRSYGRYVQPPEDEIDWDTFNYNDYNFEVISIIDRISKTVVNTIDLKDSMEKELTSYEHVDNAFYSNGKLTVKTNMNERDYDLLTGELLDSRQIVTDNSIIDSKCYKVGDYLIDVEIHWDEHSNVNSTNLNIKSSNGNNTTIEILEAGVSINVQAVLSINETKALLPALTSKGNRFYVIDLTTNELSIANAKDYEWLDISRLGTSIVGSDGQVYFRTSCGISKVSISEKTIEEFFNYSWCNVNRGLLNFLDIAECSEDSLILIGHENMTRIYTHGQTDFLIFELTKAECNPHAGKTVLELFAPDLDENIGEAITRYNNENDDYYIEVALRYNEWDYSGISASVIRINSQDEYRKINLDASSGMSNALAVDIMNGNGPDILLNTSKYGQLNNPNCLVDLSAFTDTLNPEEYFTNIFGGSKKEGALYQLPISFAINGIYTDKKYAGNTGVGFTLEEYRKYVDETLNGYDIIQYGQVMYFALLFNSMNDVFISDGKANFSESEFAELAEFVKNNVPEKGTTNNTISDEIINQVKYGNCYGIGGFLGNRTSSIDNPTILGIPSVDGRGPMFTSQCSVAISAQAENIEACTDFVKILLSNDIQTGIAMDDHFVLNRNVYRKVGEVAINYYNSGGNNRVNGWGVSSGREYSYTSQDLDLIEDVILTCTKMYTEDSSISIILAEEMPAYFLGQKDLAKVIRIAQNRVQKVLDER